MKVSFLFSFLFLAASPQLLAGYGFTTQVRVPWEILNEKQCESINCSEEKFTKPHVAAVLGYTDIIAAYLENPSKPNALLYTSGVIPSPLSYACSKGQENIVKLILPTIKDKYLTSLAIKTSKLGQAGCLDLILKSGKADAQKVFWQALKDTESLACMKVMVKYMDLSPKILIRLTRELVDSLPQTLHLVMEALSGEEKAVSFYERDRGIEILLPAKLVRGCTEYAKGFIEDTYDQFSYQEILLIIYHSVFCAKREPLFKDAPDLQVLREFSQNRGLNELHAQIELIYDPKNAQASKHCGAVCAFYTFSRQFGLPESGIVAAARNMGLNYYYLEGDES